MKKLFSAVFFALAILLVGSCKKNDVGGKATVVLSPEHHGDPIPGSTVYVKFDAIELPANPTSNYDLKLVAGADEETITVKELRPGNYFFYSEGFDPAYKNPALLVLGGIGLEIEWSERKATINSAIPVTE